MRVMQIVVAVLVAFLCYGTLAKLYRRRKRGHPLAVRPKSVRAHDDLRLTNL